MRAARLLTGVSLLAAWSLGCQDGLAPWTPGLRRELTAHDYAVYSAWLATVGPEAGGTVLVDDHTTSGGYPGLSLVAGGYGQLIGVPRPPVPPPPCPPNLACPTPSPIPALPEIPAGDEAAEDFRLQQEVSLPLERRLRGAVYELVRDPIPDDLLRGAPVVVSFSRVGFDREARLAEFRVARARQGSQGWSSPSRYVVRAERVARRWVLVKVTPLPVSVPGVILPPFPDSGVVAIGIPTAMTVPGCRVARLGVWLCTTLRTWTTP